jgi:hypothetical protein
MAEPTGAYQTDNQNDSRISKIRGLSVLHNLTRRLDKIEKDIGKDKDKPVWLRLPDYENPGKFIEYVGCRTLADLVRMAATAEENENDQEH